MTSSEPSRKPMPPGSAHTTADELGFDLPEPAHVSRQRVIALAALAAAGLVAAFLLGYLPRHRARAELAESTRAEAERAPRVEVVSPKITSSDRAIVLSGSVRALEETTIYPRANGYIGKWLVDIGDKVKEGQAMAEIETPELDQELDQARAQLAQASAGVTQADANREFSEANLQRFKQLVPAGVASQQDLDKTQAQSVVDSASVKVAKSGVAVQQANIRRLLQLKSFARVVAPFAGTVTARNIERGSLVSSGNATPLFKVAMLDPMRVFIQVPQDAAPGIKNDVQAKVTVREYPGRTFSGKIAHFSGALDPNTRTMLVEVRVPNPNHELLAGMYAEVSLTLPASHRVFELPATALLNDARGLRIALVEPNSTLRLVPVTVERDIGATVLLSSGVTAEARVVKLSSADMADGQKVEVRK